MSEQAEKEYGGDRIRSDKLSTLHVMTYNCLGLKFISHYRRERLTEIGRQISLLSPAPHIIGLQECWTQEDYLSIRSQTSAALPYGKFYYSGIFGGGLAILSKFPIEDSSMYRYPLNGRPTAFFRGDWFVGKGVACARIRLPTSFRQQGESAVVEVFCTHLHAPYEAEPGDSYICHRTAQAWEIAKLMRGAAERGHLVLGLGDFNMLPLSLAHQVITARGDVLDAWRVVYPESSIGPADYEPEKQRRNGIPSARYNLEVNGAASDGVLNTWRWAKHDQKRQYTKGADIQVSLDTQDPNAKRLDYIFIGDSTFGLRDSWQISNVSVGMTQLHPSIKCSLSDHFSIHATLQRLPNLPPASSEAAIDKLGDIEAMYPQILDLIANYTARQLFQQKFRLVNFFVSVVVAVGCFIAIWWSPRPFVSFLLILLSTIGFGAGILDGLIGGLFINSELRALKEFDWEVRNAMGLKQRKLDQKLA